MKTTYINTLTQLMHKHKDIITLTADMGFSVYEEMQHKFPRRFINTGVTEQATTSLAAGMAMCGYTVFMYAQAAFATMRCFEQVRLDVAYNFLNVKIIGVNAGFSLNQLGVSHFAIEDIGLMRMLPKMTIFSPADPIEMEWAVKKAYAIKGPVYIRYSKLGTTTLHKSVSITIGKPIQLTRGDDAVFFVSGGIAERAVEVVKQLKKKNIKISLYTVPTIKPLDTVTFTKILKKTKHVFTLEEHSVINGLGSAVADIACQMKNGPVITKFGVQDIFTGVTGSVDYLLDYNGLSVQNLSASILKSLKTT